MIYPSQRDNYTFTSHYAYCNMFPTDSAFDCSEPGITSAPVFPSDWLPFSFKSLFKFGARMGMASGKQSGALVKSLLNIAKKHKLSPDQVKTMTIRINQIGKTLGPGSKNYNPDRWQSAVRNIIEDTLNQPR